METPNLGKGLEVMKMWDSTYRTFSSNNAKALFTMHVPDMYQSTNIMVLICQFAISIHIMGGTFSKLCI